MKISLLFITAVMILSLVLGFSPSHSRFLFAGGSDSLMNLVTTGLEVQVVIVVLFCLSAIVYMVRKRKIYLTLIGVFFVLWVISGKMVALFPDGRLSCGWFFIETKRLNICGNQDCEEIFHEETTVTKMPLYRFRVKNNLVDVTILTTPFIQKKVLKLFRENFSLNKHLQ